MNNRKKKQSDAGKLTRTELERRKSGLGDCDYGQVIVAGIVAGCHVALWDLAQMMLGRSARRR
jgi:hypothetical protein